jgi:hypothetical protein
MINNSAIKVLHVSCHSRACMIAHGASALVTV